MSNFLVFISILVTPQIGDDVKQDKRDRYVNSASELSWRLKHTLRATSEAKFENLTVVSNNFYFLLHKHNCMMLEFIFEEGK